MITDKTFLGFEWPPKMPFYRPKVKKKYKHDILVISNTDPDLGYVLSFTSEQKARNFKKAAGESTNDITVEYEKTELPNINEEGFIT